MPEEKPIPAAPTAPGHEFDFEGQRYFLAAVTQDAKKRFHAATNAYALEVTEATAEFQDEAQAVKAYESTHTKVTTGHYWWDSTGGVWFRNTREGLVRIVQMCLKRFNDKGRQVPVSESAVRAMAEAENGLWLLKQYKAANPDPTDPSSEGEPSGDGSTPDLQGKG